MALSTVRLIALCLIVLDATILYRRWDQWPIQSCHPRIRIWSSYTRTIRGFTDNVERNQVQFPNPKAGVTEIIDNVTTTLSGSTSPWTTSSTTLTPDTTATTPPPTSTNLTPILLGTLIPLGVVGVALFFWLIGRRKQVQIKFATKVSSSESVRRRHISSHPISVQNFNAEFHLRMREADLDTEFESLQEYANDLQSKYPKLVGDQDVHKPKNRYVDIIPYDHSLVGLASSESYINASFIRGTHPEDFYIATQGPKRNTCVDFWNMIFEQGTTILVCLTNLSENGRIKCVEYWPNYGELLHFEEMTLFTTSETPLSGGEDGFVRTIEMTREDEDAPGVTPNSTLGSKSHVVTQYHLTSWPDHGVPDSSSAVLRLCKTLLTDASDQVNGQSEGEPGSPHKARPPMVFHCSAGVGRTGTLLGILMLLRDIQIYQVPEVDITNIVKSMREQRPKMVQSFDQYVFIYKCVKDFINKSTGLVDELPNGVEHRFTSNDP